jgi:hypothetical protein
MSARADALAARREALLARSGELRAELAAESTAAGAALGLVDRGVAFARSGTLRRVITIAAVVLVTLRPGLAWRLASRGAVWVPLARRLLPGLITRVKEYRARKRLSS